MLQRLENTTPAPKTPRPVDVEVGRRIKMRRQALGMSQEKLGEALGITFQQIQKYEKGTNRVGASRLAVIATTLNVSPAYFFPDAKEGESPAPHPHTAILDRPDTIALLDAFAGLKADDRRRAIFIVAALGVALED